MRAKPSKSFAANPGCRNRANPATAVRRISEAAAQALLLVGDAAATDPVCSLSLSRPRVDAILASLGTSGALSEAKLIYRPNPV